MSPTKGNVPTVYCERVHGDVGPVLVHLPETLSDRSDYSLRPLPFGRKSARDSGRNLRARRYTLVLPSVTRCTVHLLGQATEGEMGVECSKRGKGRHKGRDVGPSRRSRRLSGPRTGRVRESGLGRDSDLARKVGMWTNRG